MIHPEVLDLKAVISRGVRLGECLPAGSVVWLIGPLGAGKTTLARAILTGRGIPDQGTSPTYNLVHHHEGPGGAAYHLDCYRLRQPDQAADLDWETLLTADLLLIEWPERGGAWVPQASCRIEMDHLDEQHRLLEIR